MQRAWCCWTRTPVNNEYQTPLHYLPSPVCMKSGCRMSRKHMSKKVGELDVPVHYLLAGNLALGVAEGAVTGAKAAKYAEVAANLTYTCWQMYARMPTGERPACGAKNK